MAFDRSHFLDGYLSLIQRFPLRAIRNDHELDDAITLINELLDRQSLDERESDYLDVLSTLVERYEESVHPIEPASDAAVLESLLRERKQTQREVALATGISYSTFSCVIHGKRQFTREHVRAICKHFKIDQRVFH